MAARVAIVTDSTALLPRDLVDARGITVVPLQVVIGANAYDEGVDAEATSETVAAALRDWTPVSTSRPSPQAFLDAYAAARDAGSESVVSIHLSGEVSGTFESARLAAREAALPVHLVDTRQLGMAVGYAVLTAADEVRAGASAEAAAEAARVRAARASSLFYVDTLEYLRRGGRVGAAAALVGSALSVKPLLGVSEGRIVNREKVRTAGRALGRLEELAVAAAGDGPVDVSVAHLASPDRAATLADHLRARLAGGLEDRTVPVGEVGAVIGAHVGPGMVAVVVAPR